MASCYLHVGLALNKLDSQIEIIPPIMLKLCFLNMFQTATLLNYGYLVFVYSTTESVVPSTLLPWETSCHRLGQVQGSKDRDAKPRMLDLRP